MFKSISKSFSLYMKWPFSFAKTILYCPVYSAILFFALAGLFLIFFFVMSFLKYMDNPTPFALVGALLLLLLFYFSNAFKGAMVKAYSALSSGTKFSFMDFYAYASENSWNFFSLGVVKLILLIIVNAPSALIYFFYLSANPIQYADIALLLLSLFATFVALMFFHPAYISAAVYNTGALKSLGFAFQLFRRRHIFAMLLYFVHCLIWMMMLSPLIALALYFYFNNVYLLYSLVLFVPLGLLSLFVFYPIILTAMVIFFQTYTGTGKSK